jgi:hypothetical protein
MDYGKLKKGEESTTKNECVSCYAYDVKLWLVIWISTHGFVVYNIFIQKEVPALNGSLYETEICLV